MEQDKKNQTGAPSSDTTSALFVSARKKQLEQQEADRRAREKEEQRLAAEAEVRRLEREVEERKRRAEEDAAEQKRQAEEETRRIAEEARAKKTEAAINPDAVLGASAAKPSGVATAQKPAMGKKMMMIIGGAVGAVLIIVIVIIAVMGGGSKPKESEIPDILNKYDVAYYMDNGYEVWYGAFDDAGRVQTAEHFLNALKALGEKTPGFDKNSLASAINDIYDKDSTPSMWNALCTATGVDGSRYASLLSPGSSGEASPASQASGGSAESKDYRPVPDGYNRFTSKNGLTMGCPSGWKISDTNGGFKRAVVEITPPGNGFMYVINYADEGKTLNGQDVYDRYVSEVIALAKLKQDNIVSATDIKYEQFSGMEEYYQIAEYTGDLNLYVSVVKFNDTAGNIQAVFIVYPKSDTSTGETMSAIMESIEAA